MFCTRADDAKSCAVGMRNAKPGNHLKTGWPNQLRAVILRGPVYTYKIVIAIK